MKQAEQWVKEQRCPEEWASAKEIKAIQSDARQELSIMLGRVMAEIDNGGLSLLTREQALKMIRNKV